MLPACLPFPGAAAVAADMCVSTRPTAASRRPCNSSCGSRERLSAPSLSLSCRKVSCANQHQPQQQMLQCPQEAPIGKRAPQEPSIWGPLQQQQQQQQQGGTVGPSIRKRVAPVDAVVVPDVRHGGGRAGGPAPQQGTAAAAAEQQTNAGHLPALVLLLLLMLLGEQRQCRLLLHLGIAAQCCPSSISRDTATILPSGSPAAVAAGALEAAGPEAPPAVQRQAKCRKCAGTPNTGKEQQQMWRKKVKETTTIKRQGDVAGQTRRDSSHTNIPRECSNKEKNLQLMRALERSTRRHGIPLGGPHSKRDRDGSPPRAPPRKPAATATAAAATTVATALVHTPAQTLPQQQNPAAKERQQEQHVGRRTSRTAVSAAGRRGEKASPSTNARRHWALQQQQQRQRRVICSTEQQLPHAAAIICSSSKHSSSKSAVAAAAAAQRGCRSAAAAAY